MIARFVALPASAFAFSTEFPARRTTAGLIGGAVFRKKLD
jgi:hypothetical protein